MSEQTQNSRPKNAIVVLLDSLNRHMLGAYGGSEFDTPHLDRFAKRSLRFDRHFSGSLPCMPARHDILCGSLDFLWRPWGSIEIWEDALTYQLRGAGVKTMLVSDHPHLFETGGENYHTDFHAWEYVRGHEGDPWKTVPDPSAVGTPEIPAARAAPLGVRPYDTSRTWFREEADFPGPKTMATACDWLRANAGQHDRFLLYIDEFDPHEPFDTPEPYASAYDTTWEGPKLIWPPYAVGPIEKGRMPAREGEQVRASYGGKLTMIDHWFGKLLDTIDAHGLADDTMIIVCTDHGHYLGEKTVDGLDIWGKPAVPLYETLGHTPFFVSWPGAAPGTVDALTTNVDIHATLMDLFGVEAPHRTHGVSLLPILEDGAASVRDWALAGFWGRHVHVLDGKTKYARSHTGDNAPLSMWSNRWSTMPIHALPQLRLPMPDRRAWLDFMPGSDVPVIRQPFVPGDALPYWAGGARADDHYLFDLAEDPTERRNLAGSASEKQSIDLLRAALEAVEAPAEQLERLGIA
jgi:arylsulfatase A-like enzyme